MRFVNLALGFTCVVMLVACAIVAALPPRALAGNEAEIAPADSGTVSIGRSYVEPPTRWSCMIYGRAVHATEHGGEAGFEPCPRCARRVPLDAANERYSGRLQFSLGGKPFFDGCVWCLADALAASGSK